MADSYMTYLFSSGTTEKKMALYFTIVTLLATKYIATWDEKLL